MTKETDESEPFNFRILKSKKAKLAVIAKKNNRTLAGQMNAICDDCIEADEAETKPAKSRKKS